MALYKEIINEKGLVTKYHRIVSFTFNGDTESVFVYVRSYADGTYRDLEKRHLKIKEQLGYLENMIVEKRAQDDKDKQLENEKANLIPASKDTEVTDENFDDSNIVLPGTKEDTPLNKEIEQLQLNIQELTNEYNDIVTKETFLSESYENLIFNIITKYDLTELYNQLKQLEKYKGAEDI